MILILTVSDDVFSLNGVNYAKIYQPIIKGTVAIGIFDIFDVQQYLLNHIDFDEYNVDGVTYLTQEETVEALLPVIYSARTDTGGTTGVFNEVPAGAVDGANTAFTLSSVPVALTVRVWLNGVRQILTTNYSIVGSVLTFVVAPYSGDNITVDYEV